jgi:hypothetical protein
MGDAAPSFHRLLLCEAAPPQQGSVRVIYGPPPFVRTSPLDVTIPLEELDLVGRCPDVEKNQSCVLLQLDAVGPRFQELSQMCCRIALLLFIFDISELFCCLHVLSCNDV